MILAGITLGVFGFGSILKEFKQENSVTVLVNGITGDLGGDPFAFRPPLQVEVTKVPGTTGSNPQESALPVAGASGKIPDRLIIDSIKLDAPILAEHYKEIYQGDQVYIQWRVPFRRASGWHDTTARLGDVGNTVLNGHHNAYGEVFKDLINLKEQDLIEVFSEGTKFMYEVNTILLLPEKYQSMDERINNASWIMPTSDERLTLVTCWPPESNTHRLIVIAFPVKEIPQAAQ
jgi:sortase A